jgi:diguanylate cyclase (GGDEF)-like protein
MDQREQLRKQLTEKRQRQEFVVRRRQSLYGAVFLLLFFMVFTAFQYFGYMLLGDPNILNRAAGNLSVLANIGVVLTLALFVSINLALWTFKLSTPMIFRITLNAAMATLMFLWLVHIHLAGSQNTVLIYLIPSSAVIVLWLVGPREGWVYFILGALGFLGLTWLEWTGHLAYFPLSAEGIRMKQFFLNIRVISMNALLFVIGSGITLVFLQRFHRVLSEKTEELENATIELEAKASTDFLTGLYNRRFIMPFLDREIARVDRTREPLTVAILDIDDFKMVNDMHGHAAGDDVLRAVASLLGRLVRSYDLIGRIGGEEFLVVLPGNGRHRGMALAERMRSRAETEMIGVGGGRTISITVSIGVATRQPGEGTGVDPLLKTADMNLYRAKQDGKNRVCG